jgi:hypothetical protein
MKQGVAAKKSVDKAKTSSSIALVRDEIPVPAPAPVRVRTTDRTIPQFRNTFEAIVALEGMLDEVVPMREDLALMRVGFTPEEDRLRHMVKKYAGQHLLAGQSAKIDEIRETVKRGYELLSHYEDHFEEVIERAPAHFADLVSELRKEDPEILEALTTDLAAAQEKFREMAKSEDMEGVAEAYASVNNLLTDTVEGIRAERDRKKIAEVQARAKKQIDRL